MTVFPLYSFQNLEICLKMSTLMYSAKKPSRLGLTLFIYFHTSQIFASQQEHMESLASFEVWFMTFLVLILV